MTKDVTLLEDVKQMLEQFKYHEFEYDTRSNSFTVKNALGEVRYFKITYINEIKTFILLAKPDVRIEWNNIKTFGLEVIYNNYLCRIFDYLICDRENLKEILEFVK